MEWKKLLLPTDLSEEAERPFSIVADLARKIGFSVHLLHVIEDVAIAPHGAPLAPPLHAPDLTEEMARARELVVEHRAKLGDDVDVTTDVISAPGVARAIPEYAVEHGMDVIALSTHGRTGFRRMVMGSVAENVLRHSQVPVLVFPRSE